MPSSKVSDDISASFGAFQVGANPFYEFTSDERYAWSIAEMTSIPDVAIRICADQTRFMFNINT